jgi:DNA-binding transcriptional ArsR family regulator
MPPFDVGQLDDVIHGRLRLGIMAYLAQNIEVAEFNELKDVLEATQGNLSVHLRKLEDAGYVSIEKKLSEPQAPDSRASDDEGAEGLCILPGRDRQTGCRAQGQEQKS